MEDQTRKTLQISAPTWAVLAAGTYMVGFTPITGTIWGLSIIAAIYGIMQKNA